MCEAGITYRGKAFQSKALTLRDEVCEAGITYWGKAFQSKALTLGTNTFRINVKCHVTAFLDIYPTIQSK